MSNVHGLFSKRNDDNDNDDEEDHSNDRFVGGIGDRGGGRYVFGDKTTAICSHVKVRIGVDVPWTDRRRALVRVLRVSFGLLRSVLTLSVSRPRLVSSLLVPSPLCPTVV